METINYSENCFSRLPCGICRLTGEMCPLTKGGVNVTTNTIGDLDGVPKPLVVRERTLPSNNIAISNTGRPTISNQEGETE